MLHELRIRNFAIIDELQLNFGPGLNILTGETGAGKSIIIDALGLLLGDRAVSEAVRAGADRAEIEATFRLTNSATESNEKSVLTTLHEQGLEDPDGDEWLVLSREVRTGGRNVCRVNGRAVSLQILSDITARLVDVHGQGEHLSLLRPRTHLNLLDRYAGLPASREEVAAKVAELRQVRDQLSHLRQDARATAQRIDMLRFQVEEISAADLQEDEDEALEGERRRLSSVETLLTLAQAGQAILSDGESDVPGAIDLVAEAVGRVEKLARIDPGMEETAGEGQGLLDQLADLARTLQRYAEDLEFNPQRLAEVEERLELIANLKRKYGDTIAQINVFGAEAQAELAALSNREVRTAELESAEEILLRDVGELAAKLSRQRRTAGEQMARAVEVELAALHMDGARFGVTVRQAERADGVPLPDGRRVAFDAGGVDQVEFLISANPGEPLKPMVKVASGGETARLMLALKSVLADADATSTLIFDEIDQGIGGRVGAVVGQKLWTLTGQAGGSTRLPHQVLCITHLPQLAAFGDLHLTVNKRVQTENGRERTRTQVNQVDGASQIEELMQMLGAVTAAGRRSVEEMIEEVRTVKRSASPPRRRRQKAKMQT